jgi:hypothetical protein
MSISIGAYDLSGPAGHLPSEAGEEDCQCTCSVMWPERSYASSTSAGPL